MNRTPMPTIAGILCILSGALSLLGVAVSLVGGLVSAWTLPLDVGLWSGVGTVLATGVFKSLALVVGVLALTGGICAVQRRHWPWALVGSICALTPAFVFGAVAIVLTAVSRSEFERPEARYEQKAPTADGESDPSSA